MSLQERESTLQPPYETLPTHEIGCHADALRQLFALKQEDIAQLQPRLWDIAERAISSIIDPDQRKAITTYTGVMDWMLFAEPGSQLAEGMVLESDGEEVCPSLDFTIPYFNYSLGHLHGQLHRIGFAKLSADIRKLYQEKKEQIREVVSDYMSSTAEFQMLSAFDRPERELETLPLNRFWWQVRERQIDADVRKRFGLTESDRITAHTHAHKEYARQLYRLDNETMPGLEQAENLDPLHRARAYVLPYLIHAFEHDENGRKIDGWEFDEVYFDDENYGDLCIRPKGGGEGRELWESADLASRAICHEIYVGDQDTRFIAEAFMSYAIQGLVDPRNTRPLIEVLEAAAERATNYITDNLLQINANIGFMYSRYNKDEIVLLKQPTGEILDHEELKLAKVEQIRAGLSWERIFKNTVQLSTAQELMWSEEHQVGKVEKYGPSNFRDARRLILKNPKKEQLQSLTGDEDLIISAYGELIGYKQVPNIPGYILISEDAWGRYGFIVDAEGDPYHPCTVPIDKARRQMLVNKYEEIGLPDLASKIASSTKLTVSELVRHVRNESVYHLPESLDYYRYGPDHQDALELRDVPIGSIEGFSQAVRNGKLRVQCSGSAEFLRYSLEYIFEEGCANVIGGKVIDSGSEIITASGHAQTVFSWNGRLYILDATPPMKLSRDRYRLAPNFSETEKQRLTAHSPKLDKASHTATSQVKVVEDPRKPKTLDEATTELTDSLVERLKVLFETPTDDLLYKHLVRLPAHDPARKTMELLLQFRAGAISEDEVSKNMKYIQSCSEAGLEAKKRLDIDHYSMPMLEMLHNTAWRLGFEIRNSKS